MKKGTKLAIVTISFLIIGMSLTTITAENTIDSGPAFEIGLATAIGNGLAGQGLTITVKNVGDMTVHNVTLTDLNVGDMTVHNVTLTDLSIDGKILYNNRITEWHRDIEPGHTLYDEPNSLFFGLGMFTATMTVTCDEEITETGTGNGIMFGNYSTICSDKYADFTNGFCRKYY